MPFNNFNNRYKFTQLNKMLKMRGKPSDNIVHFRV
jgi:hypothetical protein